MGYVFDRVAANEDFLRVAKVTSFGYEFVDVRVNNRVQFLEIRLA
jgi:hypothetical protein